MYIERQTHATLYRNMNVCSENARRWRMSFGPRKTKDRYAIVRHQTGIGDPLSNSQSFVLGSVTQTTSISLSLSVSILTAIFPGEPGLASFIETKDDESGGDNWRCRSSKAKGQTVTTNKPTSNFLQAGCPSRHPTKSVKATKGKYHILQICLPQARRGSSNVVFDHYQ